MNKKYNLRGALCNSCISLNKKKNKKQTMSSKTILALALGSRMRAPLSVEGSMEQKSHCEHPSISFDILTTCA